MKLALAILFAGLFALSLVAQTAPVPSLTAEGTEEHDLAQAFGEAGGSAIDLIRGLEQFLRKYPATQRRPEIEKVLAKAALDSDDNARIVLYGEKVIQSTPAGSPAEDTQLLDRVTLTLLDSRDPVEKKHALEYARRYQADIAALRGQPPPAGHSRAQWPDELDTAAARALALEARATGNLGDVAAAAEIALKSWTVSPSGDGAREVAFWMARLDRTADAVEYYANAFTLEDPRTTSKDRRSDRARMGELYSKLNEPRKSLGDIVLEAYDRTAALTAERMAKLRQRDPNVDAKTFEDFVLPAVEESIPPLAVSSLKGKTVVMDFWATWCAPCRAQKPMIESVMKHYAEAKDIAFIAVDADEDLSLVRPFVKAEGWKDAGYFEGGLARNLTISQIPTVLVIDPAGKISSRLIGLVPDKFEDMLTARIEEARGNRTPQK
jgi:thiol-disulfide isomerase/thioredoxin